MLPSTKTISLRASLIVHFYLQISLAWRLQLYQVEAVVTDLDHIQNATKRILNLYHEALCLALLSRQVYDAGLIIDGP
jgi:hypothetical protein